MACWGVKSTSSLKHKLPLARLVLASIDEVFAQAKKIQDWLNHVTKLFTMLQARSCSMDRADGLSKFDRLRTRGYHLLV